MSTPKLVEDFYEHIWNDGNLDLQRNCSHRNSRSAAPSGTKCEAGKHSRIRFVLFARLLPIIVATFLPASQRRTRLLPRWFSGRHMAAFGSYEPTGKLVRWLGAALFRFEDSMIAELWVLGDLAGLDSLLRRQAAESKAR
jgi:hypothetical protein